VPLLGQEQVLLRRSGSTLTADSTASGRGCWPTVRTSSTTPSTTSRNALREPEADDAVEKEVEGAAPQARNSQGAEPQPEVQEDVLASDSDEE
jgi:hypothetical protein